MFIVYLELIYLFVFVLSSFILIRDPLQLFVDVIIVVIFPRSCLITGVLVFSGYAVVFSYCKVVFSYCKVVFLMVHSGGWMGLQI